MDKGKIIDWINFLQSSKIILATTIVFNKEFSQLFKTIFATFMIMCHNNTLLDGSYILVSVSKFGINTTENPWYRIGIVSI